MQEHGARTASKPITKNHRKILQCFTFIQLLEILAQPSSSPMERELARELLNTHENYISTRNAVTLSLLNAQLTTLKSFLSMQSWSCSDLYVNSSHQVSLQDNWWKGWKEPQPSVVAESI